MSPRPILVVRIDAAGLAGRADARRARGRPAASGVTDRTFSRPGPFIPRDPFAETDAETATARPRSVPFIVWPSSTGDRPSFIG